MIVRFRLGNITETRPVHGKLDHHVSAGRKRDGFKQLHVSVEFTKYGNTLFRPVNLRYPVCVNLQRFYGTPFASIYRDFTIPRLRQFTDKNCKFFTTPLSRNSQKRLEHIENQT